MKNWAAFIATAGMVCAPVVGVAGTTYAARRPQSAAKRVATAPALSAALAAADAVAAVGGGTATHVSLDTYQGQPVYDVHVAYQGRVWDVKVEMNGTVVDRHLASESPTGAGGAGGSEKSGVREGTGTGSDAKSGSATDGARTDKGRAAVTLNGIVFNVKLPTPPAAYATYAFEAVQAVGGISLKWVKFQERGHGAVQMNVKVRLRHGTAKVKDLFSAAGKLLRQELPTGR